MNRTTAMAALLVILALSAFLRWDAFVHDRDRLPINHNAKRQGAAISLYKGWGFKVYPIPDYRSKIGHQVDPEEYLQWPHDPVDPDTLEPLTMHPGPTVLLALTYKLFGLRHMYYQAIQLILTWLLILPVYYIGKTVFDSRGAGVACAFFYAFNLFDILYSMYLGREIHTNLGLVISLAVTAYLMGTKESGVASLRNILPCLCLGLGLGLLMYFKKTALQYFLIFPFCLLLMVGWRKALVNGAVVAVTAFLVLTPWMARNKLVFDHFSMTKEAEGLAAWAGIGTNPNPVGQSMTDTTGLASTRARLGMKDPSFTGDFYSEGNFAYNQEAGLLFKQYVASHPHSFLMHVTRNFFKNLTVFTDWPYYDFHYAGYPELQTTSGILHFNAYFLWRGFLTVIPYASLLGAIVAFVLYPRSIILLVYLVSTSLSLALLVGGHCKYSSYILTLHILYAGFLAWFLLGALGKVFARRRNMA